MAIVFRSLILFLTVLQSFTFGRYPPLPPFLEKNSNGKVCFHDDQMYMPWEKFADKACTGWCTCNGLTGSVGCVSLCPLAPPRNCPPGTEARIKNVPSGDKTGRCTCKRQVCAPSTVKVLPECVGRASGEYFIDSKCSGRCRCMEGGTGIACSSLCPPVFVRCSPGEEKEYYDQPIDLDQRCYCKRERCVAKIGA